MDELEEALVEKGPKAVEPLLEALEEPDESQRRLAARVLGRIGDRRAVPVLARSVADRGEKLPVRVDAAIALGRLGGEGVVPVLKTAFYTEDTREVVGYDESEDAATSSMLSAMFPGWDTLYTQTDLSPLRRAAADA